MTLQAKRAHFLKERKVMKVLINEKSDLTAQKVRKVQKAQQTLPLVRVTPTKLPNLLRQEKSVLTLTARVQKVLMILLIAQPVKTILSNLQNQLFNNI